MELEEKWVKVLTKYSLIKEVFICCEETDPQLQTNLQPMNEFRAALDHIMKLNYSVFVDENEGEVAKQFEKLNSHLDRAFFDICDMASSNYRNMIADILEKYSSEVIRGAIPGYYSDIKPKITDISERIIAYRKNKGTTFEEEEALFENYKTDVFALQSLYKDVSKMVSSLEELQSKYSKEQKESKKPTYVGIAVAIAGIVIGALVGILF